MNEEIINKIKQLRNQFAKEGFLIEGVFGSYVRGEQNHNSDIDILYALSNDFRNKYIGFKAVSKLDEIQAEITKILGINADLVQKNTLSDISSRYILPEVYYVK